MIRIFAFMLCFTEMEDDEELERMMLSISPSKLQGQPSKKTSHRPIFGSLGFFLLRLYLFD